MGVDGVRGALYLVMVEHEPLRPPCRGDLRVERLGVLPRPELGRAVGAPVHSTLGHLGIELLLRGPLARGRNIPRRGGSRDRRQTPGDWFVADSALRQGDSNPRSLSRSKPGWGTRSGDPRCAAAIPRGTVAAVGDELRPSLIQQKISLIRRFNSLIRAN